MARRRLIVVLLVLGVGAASCGGADRLDVDALETELPSLIAPDHPEVVTEVVCPEEIATEAGAVSRCQARLAGDPITVTLTQTDDDGAVSVAIDVTPLVVERLAADLGERLSDDLDRAVVVACAGPGLIVPVAGRVLDCTATDVDGTRPVSVTLIDGDGGYEVRFG